MKIYDWERELESWENEGGASDRRPPRKRGKLDRVARMQDLAVTRALGGEQTF